MPEEVITPAEDRLIKLLHKIAPKDKDFRVLVGLTCFDEGLTEELVDHIEKNHVTKPEEVERWLFGDPDPAAEEDK